MPEIGIIIYTYDRYRLLINLLDSIKRSVPIGMNVIVYIFDDASPKKQRFQTDEYSDAFSIYYHRFSKNHGRLRWYQMISYIFKSLKNTKHEYYFFLNDDMEFIENGIMKAIDIYASIDDPKKICMNIHHDRKPKSKWVEKQPKDYNDDVWRVYWTDTSFLCQYDFLKEMNFRISKDEFSEIIRSQKFSSGVGRFISVKLHQRKKKIFLVKRSIVIHHGNNKSKMNPEERKKHKLISII